MKKILTTTFISMASTIALAANIDFDGTVTVKIKPYYSGAGVNPALEFELPKYKLSREAKQGLKKRIQKYKANGPGFIHNNDLPARVQLGMQGAPVLNQGRHGSCVTFAVTAAYNAALGAGDYISQLCNLELGSYRAIHDNSLPYSGWKGSYGRWVLEQIDNFGIISKNFQKIKGCAGVKEYPLSEKYNEGEPMTEAEFKQHSIDIKKLIKWEQLLDETEALSESTDMFDLRYKVKQELAKGHRVVIGMMLDINYGDAGAVGQYKKPNDTWMLTPEIITDLVYGNIKAGHELVITGYDDNALVYDEKGHENAGLFTLRNSWSSQAGDNGNYYLSYEHFMMMTIGLQIIKLK